MTARPRQDPLQLELQQKIFEKISKQILVVPIPQRVEATITQLTVAVEKAREATPQSPKMVNSDAVHIENIRKLTSRHTHLFLGRMRESAVEGKFDPDFEEFLKQTDGRGFLFRNSQHGATLGEYALKALEEISQAIDEVGKLEGVPETARITHIQNLFNFAVAIERSGVLEDLAQLEQKRGWSVAK